MTYVQIWFLIHEAILQMFRNGVVIVGDSLALAEPQAGHGCIKYDSVWPLLVKVDHLFCLRVIHS